MTMDRLTQKAQETLSSGQQLAIDRHHPQLEPEHLLYALVTPQEGLARRLLGQIGADMAQLSLSIDQALGKLPQVDGAAQIYASDSVQRLLSNAWNLA
ncbi:MAG: Clp protease N-terminal domain-containing protein [Candidatus Latescibacteria bacterium]|nr:Clp protease N-terminal domain-containing protein [Candidatus Latescibacterota bacterium]